MEKYIVCDNCKKQFRKDHYAEHLNNKFPCNPNIKKNRSKCKYCDKHFSSIQAMKIHTNKSCPNIEYKIIVDKNNKIKNNIDINNIVNMYVSVDNPVCYLKIKTDYISDETFIELFTNNSTMLYKLFEMMCFDITRPKQHCMYVSNYEHNMVNYHDGKEWILDHKKNIFEGLIAFIMLILQTRFNLLKNRLSPKIQKEIVDEIAKQYNKKYKRIMIQNLKDICYQKQNIPKLTRSRVKLENIKYEKQLGYNKEIIDNVVQFSLISQICNKQSNITKDLLQIKLIEEYFCDKSDIIINSIQIDSIKKYFNNYSCDITESIKINLIKEHFNDQSTNIKDSIETNLLNEYLMNKNI
jgi:hypothetical protein